MAVKNVQKIIIIVTVQISLTLLARGQCKLNSNYTSDQFKLHRIVVNVSLNDKHTSGYPASATLSFYAMGTKITLSLNKDNSIVNPQYNIYIINKDGTKTKMKRKRKNAYRGTVNMDAKHRVNAIVVEGRWYVSFERPEGVLFFMEPDLDLGVRSNRAYNRLLHPMVVYQLHGHVRSGMRRKAMPRWNINKPLSKRKFATKSKQSARLRLKRGEVDLPKVVPTPDSGSRYQALSSSGQSYKWIYKNYNQKKVEQSADLCNVLIVTESDAWKSFGLKDYHSLASLLDFVFQQVDYILRELWPGKFTTAGLQLKTVYIHNIYGDDSAGEEHREMHGFLRETAKPNFLNSSAGILCAIRSFEEYRDSCVIHHATDRDLGGLFGVTFAKYDHSHKEFDSGAEGNKRAGDGPARNNGLTPAYIGLSSFLGCDHRSLPLGIYAHNLAKQISDDWGGGHVGSEGTLSCKTGQHEEIEHFTFREHHCKGYKRQNEKFSLLLSPQIPQIVSVLGVYHIILKSKCFLSCSK
ncbi:hypothetical protein PoB_000311400 [Plakobranchus ocellatus]|uniref:Peptidase M12B domain-containing protein n=1 Tax=Plakobranchus ocellatus TaxID=259542 RepID=A0AAV3Y307_9GAST|nr:hypothetical protein PoB_000311400 [Plakobranchus ocellatus]